MSNRVSIKELERLANSYEESMRKDGFCVNIVSNFGYGGYAYFLEFFKFGTPKDLETNKYKNTIFENGTSTLIAQRTFPLQTKEMCRTLLEKEVFHSYYDQTFLKNLPMKDGTEFMAIYKGKLSDFIQEPKSFRYLGVEPTDVWNRHRILELRSFNLSCVEDEWFNVRKIQIVKPNGEVVDHE